MEKENTAKSGTGMEEMMKGCCGMKMDHEMMKKMRDCCGDKGFTPEKMEKWMSCCGTSDKKE